MLAKKAAFSILVASSLALACAAPVSAAPVSAASASVDQVAADLVGDKTYSDTQVTQTPGGDISTTLTLTFDHPLTPEEAKETASDLQELDKATPATASTSTLSLTSASNSSMKLAAAQSMPSGAIILCDKLYKWTDDRGTYSLQRKCFGTTAPWGWQMTPALRATVVGLLNEKGMQWTKVGVGPQGRGAAHSEWASYYFHGNYNPIKAGDALSYSDLFTYRHNIGPGGNAALTVNGSFKFSSNYDK